MNRRAMVQWLVSLVGLGGVVGKTVEQLQQEAWEQANR